MLNTFGSALNFMIRVICTLVRAGAWSMAFNLKVSFEWMNSVRIDTVSEKDNTIGWRNKVSYGSHDAIGVAVPLQYMLHARLGLFP